MLSSGLRRGIQSPSLYRRGRLPYEPLQWLQGRTEHEHACYVEVREGLGQNFAGVLISDRFGSYDSRFLQDIRQ